MGKSGVYIGAMPRLIKSLCATAILAGTASADGISGEFDYYVLSLGWSPNYCAAEGDTRGEDQCDPRHNFAFTLHGLWPQYELGWPSDCLTWESDPSRTDTAAMADIMGSGGLAWHEWKKHGRCSGLSAEAYFAAARRAFGSFQIPAFLIGLDRDIEIAPKLLEVAILQANAGLEPDMITLTCKGSRFQEARLCLTKDLQPRACAPDVVADCGLRTVLMEAVR